MPETFAYPDAHAALRGLEALPKPLDVQVLVAGELHRVQQARHLGPMTITQIFPEKKHDRRI